MQRSAGRADAQPRAGHRRRKTRLTRRGRILTWTGGLLAAVILSVAGVGAWMYQRLDGNIHTAAVDNKIGEGRPANLSPGAKNILVVGSDRMSSVKASTRIRRPLCSRISHVEPMPRASASGRPSPPLVLTCATSPQGITVAAPATRWVNRRSWMSKHCSRVRNACTMRQISRPHPIRPIPRSSPASSGAPSVVPTDAIAIGNPNGRARRPGCQPDARLPQASRAVSAVLPRIPGKAALGPQQKPPPSWCPVRVRPPP
jgi:hypothetical protein